MMGKTLEELGIEVKESRSHGLAGPTILPESNIQCIDLYFNMEKIPFQEFSALRLRVRLYIVPKNLSVPSFFFFTS